MPLNTDEVKQISMLSRLRIEAGEEERWTLQLAAIVDHVVSLSAASTPRSAAAEPARALPERADTVAPGVETERLVQNAPERFRGYFAVPRVLGG